MQQEITEQPPLHLIYESAANAALWTKNKTENLQHFFSPCFSSLFHMQGNFGREYVCLAFPP